MGNIVLDSKDITKMYKDTLALDKVSVRINKGDIYALIGPNGAGKTTIMKIFAGLSYPTSGEYRILLENDSFANGVGVLIESPGFYKELDAKTNLSLHFDAMGETNKSRIDELLKLVGLSSDSKKKLKSFSLGMKQRLGIAISLINNPSLLILDEPTNGLDPNGIVEIRHLLQKLSQEGITIMISSHILGELSKFANRYGIINNGKLIEELGIEELKEKVSRKAEIIVNDTNLALDILEREFIDLDAKAVSDVKIIIYNNLDFLSKMTKLLISQGIEVESFSKKEDDLEDYYLKLIGGRNV